VEREGTSRGHGDEDVISPPLLEALAGLDAESSEVIGQVIALYREFPAWAVWLPYRGRPWMAVRPASARAPGPDLPMIWVRAGTAAVICPDAGRGRAADPAVTAGREAVTGPCRQPQGMVWLTLTLTLATGDLGCWLGRVTIVAAVSWRGLG